MIYKLLMRDECGSEETVEFEAEFTEAAIKEAKGEIEAWVNGGEWGEEGASIDVWYKLSDSDTSNEYLTDEGSIVIDVEPNHRALILAAGGDPDCDHEWTGQGEGGCNENPGVWSTGGTSLSISEHCTQCGLHRTQRITGSQRNPGEHDTVLYSLLEIQL